MEYIHKVKYYETDRMGITHHSNYVRWMEEARVDYLDRIGYGLKKLEENGVTSPVVSVDCRYKKSTTFDDEIGIEVRVERYSGVKLELSYVMTDRASGDVVCTATSSHCFIDTAGRPIAVKKQFPEFDAVLRNAVEE